MAFGVITHMVEKKGKCYQSKKKHIHFQQKTKIMVEIDSMKLDVELPPDSGKLPAIVNEKQTNRISYT